MSLLAIGWEPELRGVLSVLIGVVVLCGSVYLIMATNLGGRLAFLVALAGLFGWMALMGAIWWVYGIGLQGRQAEWKPVTGKTVLLSSESLVQAEVLDTLPELPEDDVREEAALVGEQFVEEGWVPLDDASPAFGQAQAAASVFLEEEGAFEAGEFVITDVYDVGGDRYPKINDTLDFVAFFHEPHYVVAEAAPLVPTREEPGRAPASPQIDEERQVHYAYMVRDLGTRRQPAMVLTVGGGAIFLALCYLLHRRERILRENLDQRVEVATA